ncbi:hypothetical protein H5410_057289 [Solanum commersonii]|uniref:Uncharacterized protein n=1 Tax=Solanum commersonii TaxID=4109 RepID=A0A9J5WMI4_SOLCO|nr:hypothetical protein H5410_057289 [Solanum commersonii]
MDLEIKRTKKSRVLDNGQWLGDGEKLLAMGEDWDVNGMWDRIGSCIWIATKEVFGVSQGWESESKRIGLCEVGREQGREESLRTKGEDKKLYRLVKEREGRDLCWEIQNIPRGVAILGIAGVYTLKRLRVLFIGCAGGRVIGPYEITVEFWKNANREGMEWLTELFIIIFRTSKLPKEWTWSTMIPLYKIKGNI